MDDHNRCTSSDLSRQDKWDILLPTSSFEYHAAFKIVKTSLLNPSEFPVHILPYNIVFYVVTVVHAFKHLANKIPPEIHGPSGLTRHSFDSSLAPAL